MDTQTLVSVMAWGLVVIGGGLISALIWFAMRVVSQLDNLETLFRGTVHKHDLRLSRLEDWRQMTTNWKMPTEEV